MSSAFTRAITSHPRVFEQNRYVYPVISRRSRGLSVGVNLNPDKICNFGCIYCQVDRTIPPQYRDVDLNILASELRALLEDAQSGVLFNHPNFQDIPNSLKRINDIAFSGDGEPTTCTQFGDVVHKVVQIKTDLSLDNVKLIVITNCTRFHRPNVLQAFGEMHKHNGEIWAKLDAGTSDYYDLIERTKINFATVVQNIHHAAQHWPLVIQSLFMRIHDKEPSSEEIAAYAKILSDVHKKGGLKGVQIYTVARRPAEPYVEPLTDNEVDKLAETVRQAIPNVPIDVYYGAKPDK
ncbi:MAG: radical SAM protein [Candidatus Latescibacteria bacterium]|jgi:wyosine [tRNA(Phe)-imidazoG37] synthetase (radical SAM superfamily)|nr:radical SAM protein [Candidatus Latescibacterota bacterium]